MYCRNTWVAAEFADLCPSVGRRFCLGCISLDVRIAWVNKQRDRAGRREQLAQKLQTLWPENTDQDGHPDEVTARSAEPVNEACLDWIGTGHEYNRDRLQRQLRRKLRIEAEIEEASCLLADSPVFVAAFAANDAGASKVTITATPRLTSSPASDGKRLY